MALSAKNAADIVQVVSEDQTCQSVINDPFSNYLLEALGLAGSARNAALLFLRGLAPDDPAFRRLSCLGVTEVTMRAITHAGQTASALRHEAARLSFVKHAGSLNRIHYSVYHSATLVMLTDGTEYVFDWHATLNIFNPLVARASDWLEAKNEIQFINFPGFP